MRIALVGFMGAGKSTVGPLLADALSLQWIDTDHEIEVQEGRSIEEIFRQGEQAFREIESRVVIDLLVQDDVVVSLGGGALEDEKVLRALKEWIVVFLDVALEEALRRAGTGGGRPMLARDDVGTLYEQRIERYREVADVELDSDDVKPDVLAVDIADLFRDDHDRASVEVAVPRSPYQVQIGSEILDHVLPEAVDDDVETVFIVTQERLSEVAAGVESALRGARRMMHVLKVGEGEDAKSLESAVHLWERLKDLHAHRRDLVVAVGGGVVTDLAGFVAATYGRGMDLIHVPTTLLGQVDAAIGGKTGVNVGAIKNLVGTVYQPRTVVCDTSLLASLPDREVRSGLAEVAKYGFIADRKLLWLLKDPSVKRVSQVVLREMVRRSAAIKARVVAEDEFETGGRAVLNYGHTIGHAIESTSRGRFVHGEAIALGMMAAAHLSELSGTSAEPLVDLHRRSLFRAGLPTRGRFELGQLEEALILDKKHVREPRFVLLAGLEKPEIGCAVERAIVAEAIARLEQ